MHCANNTLLQLTHLEGPAENRRLELGFGGFRRNGSSDFQCEKKKVCFYDICLN